MSFRLHEWSGRPPNMSIIGLETSRVAKKKKWAAVDPETVLSHVRSLGRLCGTPGPDRWSAVLCWDVDFIEPLLW